MADEAPPPNVNGIVNPGQWRPGQSGNPAGRPRGRRNDATVEMEALLGGAAGQITQQAIDRALEGSDAALKLCMQRMLPVMRSRPVRIGLAAGATASDVAAAMSETVRAMAAGELSPGEAADIVQVLEGQRRTGRDDRAGAPPRPARGAAGARAVRLRGRLTRLERRTRGMTRPAPADGLSDEELRRAIDLARRWAAGGEDGAAAVAELRQMTPVFQRVGLMDQEGRWVEGALD